MDRSGALGGCAVKNNHSAVLKEVPSSPISASFQSSFKSFPVNNQRPIESHHDLFKERYMWETRAKDVEQQQLYEDPRPLVLRSKEMASIRARSTKSEDESEEDSEKQVDETSFVNDPDKMFYCRLAVDSRRGIFHDFDWEKHHRDALAQSKPPSEDFTPGPSKQPSHEDISESEAGDSDESEEDDSQPESDSEMEIDVEDEGSEGAATDEEGVETLDGRWTPCKKRRRTADVTTPRKNQRSRTLARPAPHSKAEEDNGPQLLAAQAKQVPR
ncbi:hypothetical protein NLJ89_g1040 [Agrocybe chaxingu]|uniref:Uncharacterized protein n=1 Tax=Agrocybe chaxingu TaxID=84603 RepID=A0A9W8TFV1_9AGAR|nr:hypothetical protein NLJ89_g1040 [Agrocybe chaxingu]